MKIKKKFLYKDIQLLIVEREEDYLNSKDTISVTRIIAPNGGVIPVKIERKETLKSIQVKTIDLLDSFEKRGADVIKELTKTID